MQTAFLILKDSRASMPKDMRQITIDLAVRDGVPEPASMTMFRLAKLVTIKDGREVVEVNIIFDLSHVEGYVVVTIGDNPTKYYVPSQNLLRLS